MKTSGKKIAIAIASIAVIGLAGVLIWAVSGGRGSGEGKKLSPESTVAEFNRAMLSGEWDAAEELCGESMSRHMARFREEWEDIGSRDSLVFSAARRMFDSVEVKICSTEKSGDGTVKVHYVLESSMPVHVEERRVAELAEHRPHDGGGSVWKIESIREEPED